MNDLIVGTSRSAKTGLWALVGVLVTGAISVPFASALNGAYPISAEEILMYRSVPCMVIALILSRGQAWKAGQAVIWGGAVVAISSLTYYRTLVEWKIAPTVTILSLIPLVNLGFEFMRGARPKWHVILSVLLVIVGTICVLKPWSTSLSMLGLLYATIMVLASAIGFDMWSKIPRTTTASNIVFWLSLRVSAFSVLVMVVSGQPLMSARVIADSHACLHLAGYAITVVPYLFLSSIPYTAYGKMNVVHTNLIMAAGSPLTMFCGSFIAHQPIEVYQFVGVCLAVVAGIHVSVESVRAHQSATPPE